MAICRHIQRSQVSESSKSAICDQLDLVIVQVAMCEHVNVSVVLQCIVTYISASFPSPEKAPSAIDVIWLACRFLCANMSMSLVIRECIVAYNVVRFPSPEKAPLASDVIWLCHMYLQQHVLCFVSDVAFYCNVQLSQLSKSRECAIRNRCDLVVEQRPATRSMIRGRCSSL